MTENSQDVWENKYPYLTSVKDFDKIIQNFDGKPKSQLQNYSQGLEE